MQDPYPLTFPLSPSQILRDVREKIQPSWQQAEVLQQNGNQPDLLCVTEVREGDTCVLWCLSSGAFILIQTVGLWDIGHSDTSAIRCQAVWSLGNPCGWRMESRSPEGARSFLRPPRIVLCQDTIHEHECHGPLSLFQTAAILKNQQTSFKNVQKGITSVTAVLASSKVER